MKPIEFEGNTPSCSFTYTRTREGPNFFASEAMEEESSTDNTKMIT